MRQRKYVGCIILLLLPCLLIAVWQASWNRRNMIGLLGQAACIDESFARELTAMYMQHAPLSYRERGEAVLDASGYGNSGAGIISGRMGEKLWIFVSLAENIAVAAAVSLLLIKKEKRMVRAYVSQIKETSQREIAYIREETQEKEKRLRVYTENLYHQLRLPLANLKIYLELYESYKRQADLSVCQKQIQKMDFLTSALLKQVKYPMEKRKEWKTESVSELVQELVLDMADKRIHSEIEENVFVKGDRYWLKEAFTNLFVNTIEYARKDSEITVEVRKDGRMVCCNIFSYSIASIQKPEEVFGRYYTTSSDGKHFGIGLHLVYEVIREHFGQITVQNSKEGRLVFRIRLPILFGNDTYSQEKSISDTAVKEL